LWSPSTNWFWINGWLVHVIVETWMDKLIVHIIIAEALAD
jgi:hypothetical protein